MNSRINKTIGYILASILLCTLLNACYFFTIVLKLSIVKWLAFNACSLAIISYLICFIFFRIKRNAIFLAIPVLPLYYYGTMGLFVMPWNADNLFAQITHILITINLLWLLYMFLKENKLEMLGKGLLIGMLVFVPVFAYIQYFSQIYANEFYDVLQSL